MDKTEMRHESRKRERRHEALAALARRGLITSVDERTGPMGTEWLVRLNSSRHIVLTGKHADTFLAGVEVGSGAR